MSEISLAKAEAMIAKGNGLMSTSENGYQTAFGEPNAMTR